MTVSGSTTLPAHLCSKVDNPQCCKSGSGIRCLFDTWIQDPGSEMGKNQDPGPGSRVNIPYHVSESLVTMFWIKNA